MSRIKFKPSEEFIKDNLPVEVPFMYTNAYDYVEFYRNEITSIVMIHWMKDNNYCSVQPILLPYLSFYKTAIEMYCNETILNGKDKDGVVTLGIDNSIECKEYLMSNLRKWLVIYGNTTKPLDAIFDKAEAERKICIIEELLDNFEYDYMLSHQKELADKMAEFEVKE